MYGTLTDQNPVKQDYPEALNFQQPAPESPQTLHALPIAGRLPTDWGEPATARVSRDGSCRGAVERQASKP